MMEQFRSCKTCGVKIIVPSPFSAGTGYCVACWQKRFGELTGRDLITKQGSNTELLQACQLAYRKYHMDDDGIGWDQLGDVLCNALSNEMGDEEFCKWAETESERIRGEVKFK